MGFGFNLPVPVSKEATMQASKIFEHVNGRASGYDNALVHFHPRLELSRRWAFSNVNVGANNNMINTYSYVANVCKT